MENEKSIISDVSTAIAQLEEKIQDLFASDDYLNFLQKMSLLHDYSFNNVILILMQMPEASMVASYSTFQRMHRQVKKGSKAIKVLCPCKTKYTKQHSSKDENGNTVIEDVTVNKTYFKFGNVFDVSQTFAIDEKGEIKSF